MPTSYSIGNHLHLLSLGVRAAESYAAVLPKEAEEIAAGMEAMFDEIAALNAEQEKAKQRLALLTRELQAKKRESMRARARLIRLAEATFGPRDPRIKEFRPATEGKVRTARGQGGARKSRLASGRIEEGVTSVVPPIPAAVKPPGQRGAPESKLPSPGLPRPSVIPVKESGGGPGPTIPRGEGVHVSARSLAYYRYGMLGDRRAIPPSRGRGGPCESG